MSTSNLLPVPAKLSTKYSAVNSAAPSHTADVHHGRTLEIVASCKETSVRKRPVERFEGIREWQKLQRIQ